ncbi:MAG TPA: Y-family DNA polymerase [Candidatus Paceibacterota bacterium]|nr:Y-family DNA polymerase [Candidatus Paceibacterota bacterium]
MKYIALLDCNNFFVSCERLFRPDLIGIPVVVLSSNDGCIVARSKEIKDKGIPMGVPYFQVKDMLEEIHAVCFSSHFALYRDVSRRVFEVVSQTFPHMEQYSIDECFFSLSDSVTTEELTNLKRQVEQQVGIPVSIGVATSKTRAKYANTLAKKTNQVTVLNDQDWSDLTSEIQLHQIWGVGRGRTLQFAKYNLKTVKDFLQLHQRQVESLFGSEGLKLYAELNGQPAHQLEVVKPKQKSVMSTRSFGEKTTNLNDLKEAIKYHVYQATKDLQHMGLLAKCMTVMISPSHYGDYFLHGKRTELVLQAPSANLLQLQEEALTALKTIYQPGIPYKKAGILLSGLVEAGTETPSLFATAKSSIKQAGQVLTQDIYSLNQRYGKEVIKLGTVTVNNALWHEKKNSLSPAYTTRWSDLKVVRC